MRWLIDRVLSFSVLQAGSPFDQQKKNQPFSMIADAGVSGSQEDEA